MLLKHETPPALVSQRKKKSRGLAIDSGMVWAGNTWQTEDTDRVNVAGRASKLNSLVTLGRAGLGDTSYVDSDGVVRPLVWRTLGNDNVSFTVQEFLEFAIAVDEFVENKYFESWQ